MALPTAVGRIEPMSERQSNGTGTAGAPQPNPRSLAELLDHMVRAMHAQSYAQGLNPAQWNALRYFQRANLSNRTVTAFAAFHASTKSTASQTISALMRKGLLAKTPDEHDRRVIRVELTPTGQGMLKHDPLRLLVAAFAGLDSEQLSQAADLVNQLTRSVFEDLARY